MIRNRNGFNSFFAVIITLVFLFTAVPAPSHPTLATASSDSNATAVALSHDGSLVAVGFDNGVTRVYQTQDQALIDTLGPQGETPITSISWSLDDSLLATASENKVVVRNWETNPTAHRWQSEYLNDDIVAEVAWASGNILLTRLVNEVFIMTHVATGVAFPSLDYVYTMDITNTGSEAYQIYQLKDGVVYRQIWSDERIDLLVSWENIQFGVSSRTVLTVDGNELALFDLNGELITRQDSNATVVLTLTSGYVIIDPLNRDTELITEEGLRLQTGIPSSDEPITAFSSNGSGVAVLYGGSLHMYYLRHTSDQNFNESW